MASICSETHRYMNYYCVEARNGVDEFKIIYFVGDRIAAFLERDGHTLAGKVIQYSMVSMLDLRLKDFTDNRGRPELKERVVKLIRDGRVAKDLGSHGLYLLYKCAANILKDSMNSDKEK